LSYENLDLHHFVTEKDMAGQGIGNDSTIENCLSEYPQLKVPKIAQKKPAIGTVEEELKENCLQQQQ